MRKLLYIIVATIILAACVGNGKEHAALDAAESIINDRPDSALAILDSLEPSSQDFSRKNLRRWQLLRLMAQNKCDTVFRSDSLQLVLTDYYDHHGTPNEKMLAHYLLGRAYYDMGEALLALKAYEDAAAAADTTAADCDFWNLCRVYCQESLLLNYQNLPNDLLNTLDNACKAAKKAGDTISVIICYERRAMAYERLGKLDSMAVAGMVASAMYHDIGQYQMAARALYWVIPYNIENGDFNQAKKNLDIYESMSGYFDDNHQIETGREHYYSEKGKYYLELGVMDSAEVYFRKCLARSVSHGKKTTKEDFFRIHAGYHGLASYYEKACKHDSAAKYAMLSEAFNDSTYKYTYMNEAMQLRKMYNQVNHIKKEGELHKAVLEMNRRFWQLSLLSLFLVMLCVFILLYRRKNIKNYKAKGKWQSYNENILGILRNIEENLSSKILFQNEEVKNNQYSEKVMSLLNENKSKIDKVIHLIKERNDLLSTNSSNKANLTSGKANDGLSPTIQNILSVGFQPKRELTQTEWKEIEEYWDKEQYKLSKKLRLMNNINIRDFHICILTKMGLSSSSTAILIGCSQASLSMSKKRLLEKLTGKTESGRDLLQYLRSLETE